MRIVLAVAVVLLTGCGLPPDIVGPTTAPAPGPPEPAPVSNRLVAQGGALDVLDGGKLSVGSWSLSKTANPDTYTARLNRGERKEVCFISGPDRLCRIVGEGDQSDFVVSFEGHDYPTRIVGKYVPPAAKFDAAYQAAHRGKLTVLIPEVYELVNVAIALTPYAREDPSLSARFLVMRETDYYRDLQAHFAPVVDHPFVRWLDQRVRQDQYSRDKMNAYAFDYDSAGQVVRSAIYDRTGFPGDAENTLLPALEDMRSFSDQSKFRQFYAAHRSLYADQVEFMRSGLAFDRMQAWLRREFPKVTPYDHTKVVLSPLVYGHQSVTWIEADGFRELQPHINFPYEQNFTLPVSRKAKTIMRGNLLFTETNHGFINPTAEPFATEIAKAVSNRQLWALKESSADGYSDPQSLFNEYMNWGLVSLYYVDHAPPADLDALLAHNATNMKDRRGFTRFPEFAQFLVKLYRDRPTGTRIADLYPQIIAWFAAQNGTPAPAS